MKSLGFKIRPYPEKRTVLAVLILLVCFLIISFDAFAQTNSINIEWDPPTENEDGSPLNDLATYIIKYKKNSGPWSQITGITESQYAISGLTAGEYKIQVHALDKSGNESLASNQVIKIINSDTDNPDQDNPGEDLPDNEKNKNRLKVIDFDGDGISEWGLYGKSGRKNKGGELIHNILYSKNSVKALLTYGSSRSTPVYADYDGDQKTDLAYLSVKDNSRKKSLKWTIKPSNGSVSQSFNFGNQGDKVLANCYIDSDLKSDPIVVNGRKAFVRLTAYDQNLRIHLPSGRHTGVICADLNSDGSDELILLIKVKKRNRLTDKLVVINALGKKLLELPVKEVYGTTLLSVAKGSPGEFQIAYFKRNQQNISMLKPVLVDIEGNQIELELEIPKFSQVSHASFIASNQIRSNGFLFLSHDGSKLSAVNFLDMKIINSSTTEYLSSESTMRKSQWRLMEAQAGF